MNKVVYILGAGFSANLGIPVMSDFLIKAKDLFFEEPEKYRYFREVFSKIRELSSAKNYYMSDLFNIEEILSLFDMNVRLEGARRKNLFEKFIGDVVSAYTPPMLPYERINLPWLNHAFGRNPEWRLYALFVGALASLALTTAEINTSGGPKREIKYRIVPSNSTSYSVITFNYDRIIETVAEFVLDAQGEFPEIRRSCSLNGTVFHLPLAKLHGSIEDGSIVPPTWNKALQKKILPAWQLAHKLLVDATHIRFIGYSLPEGDAYAKYLFKSAAVKSERLKSIDVLCLDPSGEVRRRYEAFCQFNFTRFVSGDVKGYLKNHYDKYQNVGPGSRHENLVRLEEAHEEYFKANYQPARG